MSIEEIRARVEDAGEAYAQASNAAKYANGRKIGAKEKLMKLRRELEEAAQ